MESVDPGPTTNPAPGTPESILDALRDHPEWTERERDARLETLVASFPPARLVEAVLPRLRRLDGGDADAILRLIEANATPERLTLLAEGLAAQPELAPERLWEALAVLDAAGVLDGYPELAERWRDLNETLDGGADTLAELAAQLEGDPDEAWVALQGLASVEPEVRAAIVEELATLPLGPGLIEFLRLLAYAPDQATREAALTALDRPEAPRGDPHLAAVWASLAQDHPSGDVVERARSRAELAPTSSSALAPATPRLLRSLITALNGEGQGSVVIAARAGTRCVTAAFLCDVERGVMDVFGQVDTAGIPDDSVFDEVTAQSEVESLADAHELSLGFLAGALMLSASEAPPSLRFWLEGTVGASFRPRPFPAPFPDWDPTSIPFGDMPARVEALLAACPTWVDASPLTYTLAEELLLRNGDATPEPDRDAGAYRYLFEHHLSARLELYRRMLLGMASFWQTAGNDELGHTALALALQLSSPQHAVPSHPFHVALSTRSLASAQSELARRAR